MKAVLIAVMLASLSVPAFAQGAKQRPSGNDDNGKAAQAASDTQKRRIQEEAAAKAALSQIPDSKEKYDPWKIAR